MSTQDITNYLVVNDMLSLGGQPSEEQLRALAREGFQVVINLATINPRYSLADEGASARDLKMTYYHIPVEWGNPTEDDFESFEKVFKQFSGEKIFLHCAANFRASAFYTLYAQKHLGWSEAQANALMKPIWEGSNYPIWDSFIEEMREMIKPDAV